jgi:prepilin-type N-terminal cleavage/methylation domain-containing protein
MRKFVKGKEGFTIIELVLVLVIIAVLAGILIEPLRQGIQSYVGIETRADLTSQAREATMRMVRELRNIQREADNTPNIVCDIVGDEATVSRIRFLDVKNNDIKFYLSGTNVQRMDMDTSADNILVDQVSSLQFRYFDGSNAELTPSPQLSEAQCNNVRRILVILTMQRDAETVTMTGQAFVRDLRGL